MTKKILPGAAWTYLAGFSTMEIGMTVPVLQESQLSDP